MILIDRVSLGDFDKSDKEHLQMVDEFASLPFIHYIKERLMKIDRGKDFPFDKGYVVYLDKVMIGYLFISARRGDEVFFEYALKAEYRGKGYGRVVLNEVSDYIMDNYNVRDIVLDIDPSNVPSINLACSCGYCVDEDEYMDRNMTGKILYRKENINYIDKRRRRK